MRTLTTPAAVIGLTVLLAACGGDAPATSDGGSAGATTPADQMPKVEPTGEVIATVGDGFVTESDFTTAAARLVGPGASELGLEERKAVLDKLVTEEALWQEAAAQGLYRDPKVRKIMVNLLLREEIYANVRASDFTEEELRAYYDAHHDEFVVPEKAQVKRIFVEYGDERTQAEAEAAVDDLRRQILSDPSKFKELAEEHSEDPYRRRGGDLGYLTRDGKPGVPPEVVDMAFELGVGRLSKPFDAGGGINLVMVANRREAVERTFEQMKGSVLRKLKNERYQEMTAEYVEDVKAKFEIEIDDEALAAVKVEPRAGIEPDLSGVDPRELARPPGGGPRPPAPPPGMRRPGPPQRKAAPGEP